VGGEKAVKLIRREPDKAIMAIVGTWGPGGGVHPGGEPRFNLSRDRRAGRTQ
jgi:hypothetical protein